MAAFTFEPNRRRRNPAGWVFLAGIAGTLFTAQPVAYTTVLGQQLGMNTELPGGLQLGASDYQDLIWGGYIVTGITISLIISLIVARRQN